MKGPGGNGASFPGDRSDLNETTSGPATDMVATLTCTLPITAPNGEWVVFLGASGIDSKYTLTSVDFDLVGGHSATELVSQSVEPASVPSGSTFTLTATFTSEHWIYWIWHPAFWDATPPTNPPCDMSDPDTPNNDGTWTLFCDSTGMAPGTNELTARFYPVGNYVPLIVAWDITVS